jgi:hypothetical protein
MFVSCERSFRKQLSNNALKLFVSNIENKYLFLSEFISINNVINFSEPKIFTFLLKVKKIVFRSKSIIIQYSMRKLLSKEKP